MKHVPWAIVALCCLMPAIRSADVAVCANDFPDPKPWETEADTLWEPWMLEPTPAVDDASPIAQTAASAVAPSSRLSHLFGGSAADAAEAVSAAHVCDGRVALLSAKVPVLEAMPGALANASAAAAGTLEPGGFGAVFVVANGENDGVWLRYHPTCLGTLATVAARALAQRPTSPRRALYLYSVSGRPIRAAAGVERSLRVLQLLREGEAWQWGGVAAGFSFRIGRAPGTHAGDGDDSPPPPVRLRTLSLEPKVLQVVDVLGAATQAAVVSSGRLAMTRSPEKHYSAGFENYRTSKSAFLTGQHPTHAVVRRAGQVAARLPLLAWAEWPQLLRYDVGDWYKTHRDTFHDYKHPNQAALAAHRAASGAFDAQGPPLAVWLAWLTRRLDAAPAAGPTGVAAVAAALRGSPLDPRAWRARSGGSPNGPSDDFELALCGELLEPLGGPGAAAALGEGWHQWLGANRAARSTQLLATLLGDPSGHPSGGGGRPDLKPWVRSAWEAAVRAPPELVWPGGPSSDDTAAALAADEALEEDVLGAPWVEPNRHCTLMFYLNTPAGGGGETTFPLAQNPGGGEARLLATPEGTLLEASTVEHAGMPECSRGLRVQPFPGGGALFYHKFGNGSNDARSSHGGCPPRPDGATESVAWKINGFMWNTDAATGPSLFR